MVGAVGEGGQVMGLDMTCDDGEQKTCGGCCKGL